MATTANAPGPDLTRVCAEAETDQQHAGCSGGYCRCTCHPRPPAAAAPRPGRYRAVPPATLDELAQLRERIRARRAER